MYNWQLCDTKRQILMRIMYYCILYYFFKPASKTAAATIPTMSTLTAVVCWNSHDRTGNRLMGLRIR